MRAASELFTVLVVELVAFGMSYSPVLPKWMDLIKDDSLLGKVFYEFEVLVLEV